MYPVTDHRTPMAKTETGTDHAVTEVEFSFSDPDYPFVGASEAESCRVTLEEIVPRGDDGYAEFFSVVGADPERIVSLAAEHESVEPRVLNRHDDGALFEFLVAGSCPAMALAERGALPRTVEGIEGTGRIVAEIPAHYEAPDVVAGFLEEFSDAELVGKRQKEYSTPLFSHRELDDILQNSLTVKQREALEAAHEAGYYEWPRDTTGEEVAADIGISPATFHEHLRTAERTLVATLFEAPGAGGRESASPP